MMDTLKIDLKNIEIKLSEDKIIVDKESYEQMKRESCKGKWLSLNDVLEMLTVSRAWLLKNVLLKADIRAKIDVDSNPEGFVKYPINKGGRYFFLASKTREFFENNFRSIVI